MNPGGIQGVGVFGGGIVLWPCLGGRSHSASRRWAAAGLTPAG